MRMRGEAREQASCKRAVRNERTATLAARALTLPTTTTMLCTTELVRAVVRPRTRSCDSCFGRGRDRVVRAYDCAYVRPFACVCACVCVRVCVCVCAYSAYCIHTRVKERDARPPTGAEPDRW
uniref:Uncharacterized protein n=1 Tax=Sipha flava TaxID=143950 RepID=A0A2S2QJQ5_9HEMI